MLSGFSLLRVEDMRPSPERAYGSTIPRVKKIINSYNHSKRSLGVLVSGDKGMGKTMLMRHVAGAAQDELNLPVIIVDRPYDDLAGFIDTIGESVIVFDEFEKNFPILGEDNQAPLLGLFDGISSVKRMYVITLNEIRLANDYLVNRPGRFHYHLRFSYPTPDEIKEYLSDQGVDDKQIGKVTAFSYVADINYDHLRAIAFELRTTGLDFDEVVSDLNIKDAY